MCKSESSCLLFSPTHVLPLPSMQVLSLRIAPHSKPVVNDTRLMTSPCAAVTAPSTEMSCVPPSEAERNH